MILFLIITVLKITKMLLFQYIYMISKNLLNFDYKIV